MTEPLDVALRLSRVAAFVNREIELSLASFHGVSFADFRLMTALAPGAIALRELADRLVTSPSGVARAIAPLQRIGVIIKESQPDPRESRVSLTAAGELLLNDARGTAEIVARRVLADYWSADDRSQIEHLLAKFDDSHRGRRPGFTQR